MHAKLSILGLVSASDNLRFLQKKRGGRSVEEALGGGMAAAIEL